MIRKMEMNKRLFLFLFYLCISVYGFSADRVEGIRGVWVPAPRFTSVLHLSLIHI